MGLAALCLLSVLAAGGDDDTKPNKSSLMFVELHVRIQCLLFSSDDNRRNKTSGCLLSCLRTFESHIFLYPFMHVSLHVLACLPFMWHLDVVMTNTTYR
jgi:hypothetical protein